MNTLQTLLVAAAVLSVAHSFEMEPFGWMIKCVKPDRSFIFDYVDYGCYCRKAGSGTPVDQLDRCCQEHDKCYSLVRRNSECWPNLDSVYTNLYPTNWYSYSCDNENKKVSCGPNNNECDMFICECDRKAAECYGRAPWIAENHKLPSDRCH